VSDCGNVRDIQGLDRHHERRSHNCAQPKDAVACGHSSSLAAERGRRVGDLVCPSSIRAAALRHLHAHNLPAIVCSLPSLINSLPAHQYPLALTLLPSLLNLQTFVFTSLIDIKHILTSAATHHEVLPYIHLCGVTCCLGNRQQLVWKRRCV
jgi:hypothetical protein